MKPRLLVLEFWGLGDLVIATPFLRAAAQSFAVTLVAKPFALELAPRLWPEVEVLPASAPWTAFRGKYQFWQWPWRELIQLQRELRNRKFSYGVSARWDPRDHLFLRAAGVRVRMGFSRLNSQLYLTDTLPRPDALAHRYEFWRVAGRALGLNLPARKDLVVADRASANRVLIHSGARLPARIWPLENFKQIVTALRAQNYPVQLACDPDQSSWWRAHGEYPVVPGNVGALLELIDQAGVFIGNCSGPGHLAAICGVPTFTLYGPSMPEWFLPLHPQAEIFEGRACPYRPCSDYCRFEKPFCLHDVNAADVKPRVEQFVARHLRPSIVAV